MAIKELLQRILPKRAQGYRLGGSYLSNMAIPPGLNYQRYLELYGEVGWLFGAVSLIANSVAAQEWSAYQELKRGETKDLEDHPILDLLDHPNPFQTRYQFMLLLQTYLGLVGESFVVLNFNGLRVPGEMWLAPPGYMSIVPSLDKYISHYEYKRGNNTIRLEIPEVIHIMDANPANPYRGIGAARAVSIDIESEYYAARYQQRLFYNDATPGLIMEFPDTPPKEERENLRAEFLETHQGWRNARRPAFLWGGATANTIALAPKDMEYANLRNANKKLILGAYHIPDSLIGASEVGSRARAEADEYIFGKYTINPALMRIREALNERLCPLFDKTLKLSYANPVPADVATERLNIREDFRAGIITREEARTQIGLDAEPGKGETFLIPFSVIEQPTKMMALSGGKGGEGSGNFGHEGRPGEVGGSGEGGGANNPKLSNDEWADSISDNERTYYSHWAEGGNRYQQIRKAQKTGQPPGALKEANAIESSLDRVEPYNGEVYRALRNLDEKSYNSLAQSSEMRWDALTSATSKEEKAIFYASTFEKGKKSVIFKIQNKTGVDIAGVSPPQYAHQAEVLMRKGSSYKVIGKIERTVMRPLTPGGTNYEQKFLQISLREE